MSDSRFPQHEAPAFDPNSPPRGFVHSAEPKLKPIALISLDEFNPLLTADEAAEVRKAAVELPYGNYLVVRVLWPITVAAPPQTVRSRVTVGEGFIKRAPRDPSLPKRKRTRKPKPATPA